jgi:hypothetical protein
VSKLLNYQKNKHADLYNKIFGKTEIALIKSMKLEAHMRDKNQIFTNDLVMQVLDAYLKANPRVHDIRLLMNDL